MFNSDPQAFQQNPLNPAFGGHATGAVGPYQLSIVAQPGRTDLTLSEAPTVNGPPSGITDIEKALAAASEHAEKIASNQLPTRLALVASLFERMKSAADAAAAFQTKTRISNVPPDAADLSFGMNVRAELSNTRVEVNRVCRWGTGIQQTLQMQVGLGGPTGQPLVTSQTHVSTLNIDINTVIGATQFSADQAPAIVKDISKEMQQLMEDCYARLTQHA